ncbi:MAG: hypothetical protein IJX26_03880 [Clostridia bacterium]|nr:hypothetical protein [Clostridia bacterium]
MNKKFEFKYTAPTQEERKEIEYIQSKYKPKNKEINKLDYLRKLDIKVKFIPTLISLIIGISCLLIFGLGITMVLEWDLILWGVVIGVLGFIPLLFTYIIYNKIYTKLKDKYSAEILKLSSELLNENQENH